jgi:hypothetical protein
MVLEIPQLFKSSKIAENFGGYFVNPWNWNDILHFVVFQFLYNRDLKHKVLYDSVSFRILCLVELFTMMIKMHFLMRVFIGLSKIVELVKKVFLRAYQFLIFFFCWMMTQTVAVMIMGTEIEITEYKFVSEDGKTGADNGFERLTRGMQYWLYNF